MHVSELAQAGPVALTELAEPAAHKLATRVLTEKTASTGAAVLAAPPVHELTLRAQPRPEAVPQVRHHARAALTRWGLASIVSVAELVSAELTTNAIIACRAQTASPPIGLHLAAYPGRLVVMVCDASPGTPRPRPRDDSAVSGRGLQIVQALSADWGCLALADGEGEGEGKGKVVWCLLNLR
ncbi:MAG TPA: ATP-binding protein [Streptosporangiaceae bacterium]|nr:ATP-binding protein [Streptosporangiaceae bacterium]